eukprot:TRINITY_DN3362_c0_g1_i5.p1 TRINITY_DN3362_c0_g1~~TRINITY_DN3362_c0_g1_i5.p1  ORF type:complete len:200 (-),score=62.53 TRINITY_DN3362_c0_g1_i5:48-647(-)
MCIRDSINAEYMGKGFLNRNPENREFNQYWFSPATIAFLVEEVTRMKPQRTAFLSTPSVYYSLQDEEIKKNSYLFEFDEKFAKKNPNFVKYDFNRPEDIPAELEGTFDFIVIDPPFITREIWRKYADAALKLSTRDASKTPNAKLLLSSIAENASMLEEFLGVKMRAYKPSIPNLIYQYNFFSNYDSEALNKVNPEIGD